MTEPNAENRTLERLRPMALLIRRVSKIPEAPTNVPATISRFEPRVKPDAATARPVKALSSEISTGTSAPPMGSTKATPKMSASSSRIHSSTSEPETRMMMMNTSAHAPMMALMTCWPG